MLICTVNFDAIWGDIAGNVSRMEADIVSILQDHPSTDTIVFPELCTSGYILDESIHDIAQSQDGALIAQLKQLASTHQVNLIGGFIEKEQEKIYNSAFAIDKQGKLITVYRKNHLFTQSVEPDLYTPGYATTVFELEGIRCGLYICFDIRYPRLFEAYKKQGVQLMLGLYNWPKGRSKKEIFKFLIQTRAHENQLFIAGIDRSGEDKNAIYESNHLIVNPLGEAIGQSVGKYHLAHIDPSVVSEIEAMLPLKAGWNAEYTVKD